MATKRSLGSGEWHEVEIIQNTELTKFSATTVHGENEKDVGELV